MKRLLNIDFALVQAIYWMLYTVAGSFVSVLLLEKDYTNASIGTIIAVGSVLAILLQTVITHVTDRSSRLDSIGMIKILTLLLAAGVFAVLLIGEKSAALTIAYVGVIILHTAMHPFVNALSFKLEETGLQVNYGVGRSMGSLAAGGISFVLGYLVVWFQPEIVLYLALVNLSLLTLVIFATGHHYKKAMSNHKNVPKNFDAAKESGAAVYRNAGVYAAQPAFCIYESWHYRFVFRQCDTGKFYASDRTGYRWGYQRYGRCDLAPLRL